jgi:hypothetical protein
MISPLPPRLRTIVDAEYPRYSAAEMARRRVAVEALLAEAGLDHLVFCGANRSGSAVQWLTQWPVTAEAVGVLSPGRPDALFVQYVNHVPLAQRLAWGGESSPVLATHERRFCAWTGADDRIGTSTVPHAIKARANLVMTISLR